jgi:5,10-methylenetetrahydrofolate reductase
MSANNRIPVSLEFFPPKTPEGAEKLRVVRQQLYGLKPEFCSVTFGAGGSTQEGTFNTVRDILAEGTDAASHFSCVGATKATVRVQLATLKAMGVKRLVALRGDLPSGYGEVDALGISVPVVPGIMPITSSTQLMRFSDACGAEIPRWIRLRLQSYGDDVASIKAFGLEVVTDLCEQLRAGGAPALHFYTMNQSAPTLALCENLGLSA